MLNAHLTYDAQRALAFTFPTSYIDAAKTTILKIDKPNYRFLKTASGCLSQRSSCTSQASSEFLG